MRSYFFEFLFKPRESWLTFRYAKHVVLNAGADHTLISGESVNYFDKITLYFTYYFLRIQAVDL